MGQVMGIPENIDPLWVALGAAGVVFFAGLIVRKVIMVRLAKWASKTQTQLDDVVIAAIRAPMFLWFGILAIHVGLNIAVVPEKMAVFLAKALQVLWLASITLVAAQILSQLVKVYARRIESTMPVTTLTENVVRIVVFVMGALMILQSLGVSVAPILATLGVGGLAVALALQDTLSNLFSGFHIIMARQIKVGDLIRLEGGQEGIVSDINWRTTQIRMLPNNVVLIPNSKLAQAIVINYCLPDKEMAVTVEGGVHYDSDLKRVERVTLEVAREVMHEVPGGVKDFEPSVRFHTFADSSINFTVALRAREYVDQSLLKHEFICRLHDRYRKEGIVIPYPIRTIIDGRTLLKSV